jgi:hypothetical protein
MFDKDTPPTYPVTVQDYIDGYYQKPWSDVLSWFLTRYLEEECPDKLTFLNFLECDDAVPASLYWMVVSDKFPDVVPEELDVA